MQEKYETVPGTLINSIAYIGVVSARSEGVTIGDLVVMINKEGDIDTFTKDRFEGVLKKVSRRIKPSC